MSVFDHSGVNNPMKELGTYLQFDDLKKTLEAQQTVLDNNVVKKRGEREFTYTQTILIYLIQQRVGTITKKINKVKFAKIISDMSGYSFDMIRIKLSDQYLEE